MLCLGKWHIETVTPGPFTVIPAYAGIQWLLVEAVVS